MTLAPPDPAFGRFITHPIAAATSAWSVFAADMDDDGDLDVLSASYLPAADNNVQIAWYENDGDENYTAHTITSSAEYGTSVFAVDVDGDGDLDVLSASAGDDTIAWYENDGDESFTLRTITTSADGATSSAIGASSVFAADVDGDGDMDVLSASWWDEKLSWYENDGAQGFTARTITASAPRANSVFAADVDGDGDMDVLSASLEDGKIAWYENDGTESFSPHTIATTAGEATSVFAADVDGDGDIDVLSASYNDNTIAWYENDGVGNFTTHAITTSADGPMSVYAADVDGDGDIDVLSAPQNTDRITWYENDGDESFTAHTFATSNGAYSIFVTDADGDGDLDVLSASFFGGAITWYENLSPVDHPQVTALSPDTPQSGPVDHIDITFNTPMDPATFTPEDITILKPTGANITLTSVTPIDSGETVFRVAFPAQTAAGTYRVDLGPEVSDSSGRLLDQDGDGIFGEPEDDAFADVFQIAGDVPGLTIQIQAWDATRGGRPGVRPGAD